MHACRYRDSHLSPPGPPLAFVLKANLKVGLLREGSNSFPLRPAAQGWGSSLVNIFLRTDKGSLNPDLKKEKQRLAVSQLAAGYHPRPGLPNEEIKEVSGRHGPCLEGDGCLGATVLLLAV